MLLVRSFNRRLWVTNLCHGTCAVHKLGSTLPTVFNMINVIRATNLTPDFTENFISELMISLKIVQKVPFLFLPQKLWWIHKALLILQDNFPNLLHKFSFELLQLLPWLLAPERKYKVKWDPVHMNSNEILTSNNYERKWNN